MTKYEELKNLIYSYKQGLFSPISFKYGDRNPMVKRILELQNMLDNMTVKEAGEILY